MPAPAGDASCAALHTCHAALLGGFILALRCWEGKIFKVNLRHRFGVGYKSRSVKTEKERFSGQWPGALLYPCLSARDYGILYALK